MSSHASTRAACSSGHAVALTLGRLFELNAQARTFGVNDPRGVEHVERTPAQLCALLGQPDAAAVGREWTALLVALGLETALRSLGVTRADLDRLVAAADLERLGNHPVRVTPHAARALLASLAPA